MSVSSLSVRCSAFVQRSAFAALRGSASRLQRHGCRQFADSASNAPAIDAAAAPSDQRVYRPMTETVRTFLNTAHFFALLRAHGTTFFSGVPDSLLKDMCAFITDNVPSDRHVIAANEGTALAVAAGHHLATGSIPCVYLQNSGLGNTVNPLVSLCSRRVYSIPVLLVIGWRGEPSKKDEPQHLVQGSITPSLLQEMNIAYEILPDYAEGAFEVLDKAYATMKRENGPFALLVKRQTFNEYNLKTEDNSFDSPNMLHREEILEMIVDEFPTDPIITTTGFTSREMFELRVARKQSHEHDFLTVGSMGHCSSIATGIALTKRNSQVFCIDGDGAAIMHMGAFATVGCLGEELSNFKHILINNAVHDSVGGQPTGGRGIDFAQIARACGYSRARTVSSAQEIKEALCQLRAERGPSFLELRCLPGARADLGRPTTTTLENKEAFMRMLHSK